VCFDLTDQLLIRFSSFLSCWRKKWEFNETVHHLFRDLKKAYYDSVRRGILFDIILSWSTHEINQAD
jgi:hypothetical protein